MSQAYRRRWSDNDQTWGPFTYAREDRTYRPLAISLKSMDDEDEGSFNTLRLSGFGHTLIIDLPQIIKPYREKVVAHWDAATVDRLGRDWYWNIDAREYSVSYSEGYLSLHFGRQTHDSTTCRQKGYFLPWTQWRHVRFSLYGLDGEHFWTEKRGQKRRDGIRGFDAQFKAESECPKQAFAFKDFDGEEIVAITHIDEREWRFGEGLFKWLSIFRRPKIRRSLSISFSKETGKRKGSWKGGTVGHSIDLVAGELHEQAFKRYCAEHGMTFVAVVPPPPNPHSEKVE